MSAKLRLGSVIVCVIALCALGAAPVGATSPGVSRSSTIVASAASASTAPAAGAGSGLVTLGHAGWDVQSTAATTDWTTRTGASQAGNEISAPGFSTAGWLPVENDDAGAVGT